MLAFAFIATIGAQGIITQLAGAVPGSRRTSSTTSQGGTLLYHGGRASSIPYLYFQIPLMVLTFMPAMEGLKATWGEANATLGGTRFTYWTRIGFPILAPAFFGSLILLFANAFSSYATAAALISQGGLIVARHQGGSLSARRSSASRTAPASSRSLMVVTMIIVMWLYSLLERRASRWRR